MNKKQKEILLLKWFMPVACKGIKITENDIKKFFEYDERGLHKEDVKMSHFTDGFNALISAKQNRGRNMEFWEDGVMSGNQPYFTLLGGYEGQRKWYNPVRWLFRKRFYNIPLPRYVVDFMKKEMFKGIDAEQIERVYKDI